MKMTYDREADALYIRLLDKRGEVHVSRISEDVACDVDEDGQVVGIEVLNASRVFDHPRAPSVELEYLAPRATRIVSDPPSVLSEKFSDAVALANRWHAGHRRKGGPVPYLAHLLGVASLVLEAGGDEELAIAAMLHDAIEDRPEVASLGEIEDRFGARVKDVVEACTDTLDEEKRGEEDWQERKDRYLEHLRKHADDDALLVSCADKLHNARAIERDLREHGEELWTRFNVSDPNRQLRYYRSLAAAFTGRGLEPRWLSEELERVVGRVEDLAG